MTRKSTKKDGRARYICKASCRKCTMLSDCYSGKNGWKEIDFYPGQERVKAKNLNEKERSVRQDVSVP